MAKKIMLLGGNFFQMTATRAAKQLGYHVIDVDYLPENPAHQIADEYYNISTLDKEQVLEKARELQIDGILSYASDVSAPTAAYVAEALGLPTNPYESVCIMTHKNLFRQFMREHGYPVPAGGSFTDGQEALSFFRTLTRPAIVKPIDSSGSRGVAKVSTDEQFVAAWSEALSYSREKQVIVEEFIERQGYQIDGDAFMVDGEIVFWGICDQHHDLVCSPYVPAGLSYPPTQEQATQEKARRMIRKLLGELHMTMGGYNIEYIVGTDGEIYILEIGPRHGGNLIPDTIRTATGVDLPMYAVMQAVGDDCSALRQEPARTCATSYIVHARQDGILREVRIDEETRRRIVCQGMFARPGEMVRRFTNGSLAVGAMVLTYETPEQMCGAVDHMDEHIQVIVD